MSRQLYVHLGEVTSVCRYDSDKEKVVECDVQCVLRSGLTCEGCWFHDGAFCNRIACASAERPDGESVIFKTL